MNVRDVRRREKRVNPPQYRAVGSIKLKKTLRDMTPVNPPLGLFYSFNSAANSFDWKAKEPG